MQDLSATKAGTPSRENELDTSANTLQQTSFLNTQGSYIHRGGDAKLAPGAQIKNGQMDSNMLAGLYNKFDDLNKDMRKQNSS